MRRGRFGRWCSLAVLALMAAGAWAAGTPEEIELGRRIYEDGVLPSGAPLAGRRFDAVDVRGAQAACANCHRKSGMGSVEGDIAVPPIGARYLYPQAGDTNRAVMDPRSGKRTNQRHEAYDDVTLARAIREGRNVAGERMNAMMPRYALNDAELRALTAYLDQLNVAWSPGVTRDAIRLATVITPGTDAARRRAFIDTLRTAVNQKNGATAPGRRSMIGAAEFVLRTGRKWELEVWELTGAPETWAAQLDARYRAQPVFAILSGLAEDTWAPVHAFCERERVPCWLPVTDVAEAHGEWSLYFSRGVELEAEVLAQQLLSAGNARPARVIQVQREGEVGRRANAALAAALAGSGIRLETRVVDDAAALTRAVGGARANDALVMWLRATDLATLEAVKPAARVYLSGALIGGESAVPAAWQKQARILYPYELPARRADNIAYFRAWLRTRNLPLVDEPLQARAFYAVDFLTDTTADMLDNLYRDYLVERAENMMSRNEAGKAEQQLRERAMYGGFDAPARARQVAMHARPPRGAAAPEEAPSAVASPALPAVPLTAAAQHGTTIYPRMGLGPGQRFASKGAYVVRVGEGGALEPESAWLVPERPAARQVSQAE